MSEALSPSPMVSVIQDVAQVGRRLRQPRHDFQVRHRPWEITPFMIAPVLPGDSLERLDLQCTAVSDPVKNPLIGWWLEHHYYYVKLVDLEAHLHTNAALDGESNDGVFRNLFLAANANLDGSYYSYVDGSAAAGQTAPSGRAAYYGRPGHNVAGNTDGHSYDFVQACTDLVVRHYFRDDDEWKADGTPDLGAVWDWYQLARARMPGRETWLESLQLDGEEGVPDPVLGPAIDVEDPYYEMWLRLQEMKLTDLTYELWLKDQGIRGVETRKPGKPTLIRHSRSWKKPSVTPDSAGNVGAVLYWDISEDATKKRFFKEPGFVIGITVARPKVYLANQLGAAVNDLMTNAFAWMPKALSERPELSLRKFADGDGPLGSLPNPTAGYWVDVVDLFVYGDQFINFDLASTDAGLVALPGPTLAKKDSLYPARADMEKLFTSAAPAGDVTGRLIKQEGVTQMRVLSRLRDLT